MNCKLCGAAITESDAFCGACGTPVANADASQGTPTPPPPPPPPPPSGYQPPPPMPPPMAPPMSGYGPQHFADPATGAPLAEWWQRAVAVIIDAAIFWVPGFIIILIAGGVTSSTTCSYTSNGYTCNSGSSAGLIISILIFIGYFAYYVFFNGGETGQTIGKKVMGIATRDENGQGPIGYGRAAGRFGIIVLLDVLCVIPLLIDYLSPLWDPRRQAWHDKAVHSVVVTVK